MSKKDTAVACFKQGFACSQAVLFAFADDFGLDHDTAVKLGTPFGGGMGRMGDTCGAVTGALLVLGLKFGVADGSDRAAREACYEKVRECVQQFKARHQTTVCRELLGCDISTLEGLAQARERNLFATRCVKYVEDAAAIVEGQISGNQR